ncbi:MAG: hypothetical protein P4L34_09010 [Paludibacter sp.]|nr:hypothetical protein [Paludibacter sp.]
MKKILTLILVLSSFVSCSNQAPLNTDGQLIGAQILQLVNSEGVTKATTYLLNYSGAEPVYTTDEYQQSFIIGDQIIQVGSSYYNLSKLTKYEIISQNNSKYLILYFDGIAQ